MHDYVCVLFFLGTKNEWGLLLPCSWQALIINSIHITYLQCFQPLASSQWVELVFSRRLLSNLGGLVWIRQFISHCKPSHVGHRIWPTGLSYSHVLPEVWKRYVLKKRYRRGTEEVQKRYGRGIEETYHTYTVNLLLIHLIHSISLRVTLILLLPILLLLSIFV